MWNGLYQKLLYSSRTFYSLQMYKQNTLKIRKYQLSPTDNGQETQTSLNWLNVLIYIIATSNKVTGTLITVD